MKANELTQSDLYDLADKDNYEFSTQEVKMALLMLRKCQAENKALRNIDLPVPTMMNTSMVAALGFTYEYGKGYNDAICEVTDNIKNMIKGEK